MSKWFFCVPEAVGELFFYQSHILLDTSTTFQMFDWFLVFNKLHVSHFLIKSSYSLDIYLLHVQCLAVGMFL